MYVCMFTQLLFIEYVNLPRLCACTLNANGWSTDVPEYTQDTFPWMSATKMNIYSIHC